MINLDCVLVHKHVKRKLINRVYAHGIMAAMLLFQNNEPAAIFVYQTNSGEVQLFSYVNTFFCSNKFA